MLRGASGEAPGTPRRSGLLYHQRHPEPKIDKVAQVAFARWRVQHNSMRPRRSELEDAGVIEKRGGKVRTNSGHPAHQYAITRRAREVLARYGVGQPPGLSAPSHPAVPPLPPLPEPAPGGAPDLGSPCFPLPPAAPARDIRTPDVDQVRTWWSQHGARPIPADEP